MGNPILARRLLRRSVLAAIQQANSAGSLGWSIHSPGDWATVSARYPAVLVRNAKERKHSNSRAMPNFTTIVGVEVEARLDATTGEDAQDNIEALGFQLEQIVLGDPATVALIQQVAFVETETEITADAKKHLAGIRIVFGFEIYEEFEPNLAPIALQGIDLHADLGNVFDPTGTYSNPPFPDAATPAPRTSGPDGRDEGGLSIDLPQ